MDADPSLDQLLRLYRRDQDARNLSENTIRLTDNAFALFRRFLGDREIFLSDISTGIFQDFYLWLRDTPKDKAQNSSTKRRPGGIANRMRSMRTFVKWLEEAELLNPKAVVVKEPATPKEHFPVFSDGELDMLFASRWCDPATEQGARNRSIFSMLLHTGLRVSEIGSLEIEDTLVDDRLLRIHRAKGGQVRHVPFSREAQADLIAWLKFRGMANDRTIYELTTRSIQSLFREVELDLKFDFFPHKCRHTFASRALNNGMEMAELQRILGHSQIATTNRYITLSTKDLQDKYDRVFANGGLGPRPSRRPTRVRRSLRRQTASR